jgi:hypothetical protein
MNMSSRNTTDTPLKSDANGYYLEINNGIHELPMMNWTSTNDASFFVVAYNGETQSSNPLSATRADGGAALRVQCAIYSSDRVIVSPVYGNKAAQMDSADTTHTATQKALMIQSVRKTNVLVSVVSRGSSCTAYLNGGTFTKTESGSDYGGTHTQKARIGHDGGTYNGGWYSGDDLKMREILIYKGALSDTDRQKVEGYLAWKWRLQTDTVKTGLPATHSFYSINPSESIIAPIDIYRINHIKSQKMPDTDTTLMGATVPLIQAGGFVYNAVSGGHTSINDIFNRYVSKEVGVQSLTQKNTGKSSARKTHKK